MKTFASLSVLALLPFSAFAELPDLTLPGERWVAKFDKFICAAFGPSVTRPDALEKFNVQFETLTSDRTLDNALLKASFEENGKVCRYNAIILADNAAQSSRAIQSIAFVAAGDGASYKDCLEGKAVLDRAFEANAYLYYGHPHNLAFMMPNVGAEGVCGEGASTIGANFVVSGRIDN